MQIIEEDEFSALDDDEDESPSAMMTEPELNPPKLDTKDSKIKPLTFAEVRILHYCSKRSHQSFQIPTHFRLNWASYQVESVMLIIIIIYSINFVYGKTQNHAYATKWYEHSLPILEQQFALVADDGTSQEAKGGHLMRETENCYAMWW